MAKVKCCICGKDLNDLYGNNPYPIIKDEKARCCSACNDAFVIPARMGENFSFEEYVKSKGVAIYTIDKLKEMYVNKELENGMYSSVNEDGCDVVVFVQQGAGFDIHTNQKNGWVRCDSYDYDEEDKTWTQGESYMGRWKEDGE